VFLCLWSWGWDLCWQTAALCGWGVGVWPQKEHLSKSGPAASCVMPLGGFGNNPTVMSPHLSTLSTQPYKRYITCQIHSVITGLINMLHSKGTPSLFGCGICMNDMHMCKCPHTNRVLSYIGPCCLLSHLRGHATKWSPLMKDGQMSSLHLFVDVLTYSALDVFII